MVNRNITLKDLAEEIGRANREGKKYIPLPTIEAHRLYGLLWDARYYMDALLELRIAEAEKELGRCLIHSELPSLEALRLKENVRILDEFIVKLGGRSRLEQLKSTKNIR